MKIILKELKEGYVFETLEDGTTRKVLYEVDEDGEEFVDMAKRDTLTT